MKKVPVVDQKNKPLMPTSCSRARRWIKSSKATPFWKRGIFCIRLNFEPSDRQTQPITLGLDPGGTYEGYTAKAKACTILNMQAEAVMYVKDKMETRKNMRRTRRYRKTPCRKPRFYRQRGKSFIPPSTRARWQWKIRLINFLKKILPISDLMIEDIKATSKKGCKKWNQSFNTLQVGKNWFYAEVGNPATKQGHETATLRDALGLKKSKSVETAFKAHCIDSWVLANSVVGGHTKPDNTEILYVIPLNFPRRQLHVLKPAKGGKRKRYGGTRSGPFKKGSIVKHNKIGVAYVGGHDGKGRISLYDLDTGDRLGRNFKPEDCKFLCYNSWRFSTIPQKTRKNKKKTKK